MKEAINEKYEICKVENIVDGSIRSIYKCYWCFQKVIFIKESYRNSAHFRHYKNNQNIDCNYYKNNFTEQDKINHKNNIENKMSEFHTNWQNMFPKYMLEVKLYNSYKYKRADIYIETIKNNIKDEQGNFIFPENTNSLVIEIQNSNISGDEIMKREYFYKSETRQLLWIFNLKNTYYGIERFVFYCKTKYIIKIKGGYMPFMNLLIKNYLYNKKPNIILDSGDNYLYLIKNDCKINNQYIEIKLLKRKYFLNQLINSDIKENIKEIEIDYEINYMNNIKKIYNIDIENKRKRLYNIHKCFYIIENLQFKYFYDNYYDYFIIEGFIIIGEILSKLSDKNFIIMNLWINWIERNIPRFQDKMTFGKYEGYKLYMIDKNYITWLYFNLEISDEDLESKISLLAKMYDKEYLKNKYMNPKYNYSIGTLIFMYREINNIEKWLPPYVEDDPLFDVF